MKIVVIDGQGGGMGRQLVEQIKKALPAQSLVAVGTNAMATAAMLRAGADVGATGENAVRVCARDADIIVGPMGIVLCDALMGEVTASMAAAVGQSAATKVLLPVSQCRVIVAGARALPMSVQVAEAVKQIEALCAGNVPGDET